MLPCIVLSLSCEGIDSIMSTRAPSASSVLCEVLSPLPVRKARRPRVRRGADRDGGILNRGEWGNVREDLVWEWRHGVRRWQT